MIVRIISVPGGQITPASSEWVQNSGLVLLQFVSLSSLPRQPKLVLCMSPLPGPKNAPRTEMAPATNIIILSKNYSHTLMVNYMN